MPDKCRRRLFIEENVQRSPTEATTIDEEPVHFDRSVSFMLARELLHKFVDAIATAVVEPFASAYSQYGRV